MKLFKWNIFGCPETIILRNARAERGTQDVRARPERALKFLLAKSNFKERELLEIKSEYNFVNLQNKCKWFLSFNVSCGKSFLNIDFKWLLAISGWSKVFLLSSFVIQHHIHRPLFLKWLASDQW